MSRTERETSFESRQPAAGPRRHGLPQAPATRARLRQVVRDHVTTQHLVPPLTLDEIHKHAAAAAAAHGVNSRWLGYLGVLVSNAVWESTVAAVPFDRRVLFLPQCLRDRASCPAQMDLFGMLCEQCGRCPLGALLAEAEELGYVVLIAEGTTVVTRLLDQGRVDAVLGVSCLSVLERAFPHMAAEAIPGIAIPLLCDGCDQTKVDLQQVRKALLLRNHSDPGRRLAIGELRQRVHAWFEPRAVAELLHCGDTRTERIAVDWLARSGKRWRPFLCVAAYKALDGSCSEIPADVRQLALAVECFHKASLIHDDIEDGDDSRYGQPSLHCQHGTAVALNVGDFLLGEGYRLIASCSVPPARRSTMLAVAAEGHRTLCLGQGEELDWVRNPVPLQPEAVLAVFRRKTAPAFEVALRLGALCWDADETVCRVLQAYSRALGTAYQIRDDLTDGNGTTECDDIRAQRPSLLLALAWENTPNRDWAPCLTGANALAPAAVAAWIAASGAREKARMLLEHYKNEAIRSLAPLQNANLKTFLRRVVGRILGAEAGVGSVRKTESGDDGDGTE